MYQEYDVCGPNLFFKWYMCIEEVSVVAFLFIVENELFTSKWKKMFAKEEIKIFVL